MLPEAGGLDPNAKPVAAVVAGADAGAAPKAKEDPVLAAPPPKENAILVCKLLSVVSLLPVTSFVLILCSTTFFSAKRLGKLALFEH